MPPQVMALAAQCTAGAYFGKYVIVVDDDIDPTNIGQVLWAIGDALAAGAIDRHFARDLEHVSRSEPQPAGNPPLGLEGADRCLHGLLAHQGILAADQAR
jgi:hypothetical protein